MDEFLGVLRQAFIIDKIALIDFGVPGGELRVEISIVSKNGEPIRLGFKNRTGINLSNYGCSERPTILVEDITAAQWDGVRYKVSIMDDVMSFYCWEASLLS